MPRRRDISPRHADADADERSPLSFFAFIFDAVAWPLIMRCIRLMLPAE